MQPDGLTGARIAAARKERGVSQRTVAAALDVTVRTLQNYEAGRFVPYRHLDTLARLLGCSSAWLLQGTERRPDELIEASRRQRARLRENLTRLRELSARLEATGRSARDSGESAR